MCLEGANGGIKEKDMGGPNKVRIVRIESDFYPTEKTVSSAIKPSFRSVSSDSFLECQSQSPLACLGEGFVKGFIAGFTFPLWASSACAREAPPPEAFASPQDAMQDSSRRIVPNDANDASVWDGGILNDGIMVVDSNGDGIPDASETKVDAEPDQTDIPDQIADLDTQSKVDVELGVDTDSAEVPDTSGNPDGNVVPDGDAVADIPNTPPVIQMLYPPEAPIPSGDNGCKGPTSFYTFGWEVVDAEKDPLKCKIELTDKDTTQAFLFSMPLQAPGKMLGKVASDQLPDFARYNWSVSCEDPSGKISKKSASDVFVPIDKDTEFWVPFWEGAGTQVMSYGINKLIGKVEGTPQWIPQKGFVFDGKTRVVFEKTPAFFKSILNIKDGTIIVKAKPSGPQVPLATLVDITDAGQWIRIAFEVNIQQQLMFTHCHNSTPKCFSTASPKPMEMSLKTYTGIHQPSVGTKMYVDGKEVAYNDAWKDNLDLNDDWKPVVVGDWWPGGRVFAGEIHDVKIIRRGPLDPCK